MMNGGGETDPTGDGGNRILKDLWEYSCCPVIIYSSNPVLGDDRKHPFIHKIEKGKGSQKILLQCVENYMPFLNAKNDLILDLSHVFTDTLRSTAIALFSGATSQSVGEILIRLTRRRIAAVMDLGYNEDTKLQPYEQYIYPVLEKDWLQGDIIRNKETGDYALVLSPSCDLVVRKKNGRDCIKTETILCAHCVPFSKDKIANYFKPTKEVKGCANCDSCATNTEECKRSRLNEIHKQEEKQFCSLLNGGYIGKYYMLPKLSGVFDDMLANLKYLFSITFEQMVSYERIASIDSPFREKLNEALFHIAGRLGTPDRDFLVLAKKYIEAEQ